MPKPSEDDVRHLRRCVELAKQAADAGDEPFGSVLVDADGDVLAEDRNRAITCGDPTRHPEFELARWAAQHLTAAERARSGVYTSGEHCPMCAAAHASVGLGRIVYAVSAAQLATWRQEWGLPTTGPVRTLPVHQVAPDLEVAGPAAELHDVMHDIHRRHAERRQSSA